MNVVADTPDLYGNTSHFPDDATNVGEDLTEVFIAYLHAVVLDVEDDVDVVFYE